MHRQRLLVLIFIFCFVFTLASQSPLLLAQSGSLAPKGKVRAKYVHLPLSFEPCSEVNCGPGHDGEFLTRGPRGAVLVGPREAAIALRSNREHRISPAKFDVPSLRFVGPPFPDPEAQRKSIETSIVRMKLLGANARARVVALDKLPGKVNYFIGNDSKKWRTDVPTYSRVFVKDVYPGIDIVYHGGSQNPEVRSQNLEKTTERGTASRATGPESLAPALEYDFVVAPGADPTLISLKLEGAEKPDLSSDGNLVLRSANGGIELQKPLVYQLPADGPNRQSSIENRQSRTARFVLEADNRIGFALGPYDRTRPLVIDPVLIYSTYLGGISYDYASGIAVDSLGNTYITGYTQSSDFPTQNALLPEGPGGNYDAFVAKLSPSGDAVMYSTYLGGRDSEVAYGIAVDSGGNAYITGTTQSSDFPTSNAFQAAYAGGGDAFVTKLNSSGNALVYSTYLGGSTGGPPGGNDLGYGIAVDSSGCAYVTGWTNATNFPTKNAFQAANGGLSDAFLTKLTADGTALVYSTYLGGADQDSGQGIAVDSSGAAYITGQTTGTHFPVVNAIQASFGGGGYDAFVAKINAPGSAIMYSTYLGGGDFDYGSGIAVDPLGNALVTGVTYSTDFPTKNAMQASKAGDGDAFVAKLDAAGDALVYSTYLGGTFGAWSAGIATDPSGDAYVAGLAGSSDFPIKNPIQSSYGGNSDAFITELDPAGSLLNSTFLGGTAQDYANSITIDSSGYVYLAGLTYSTDFPTANPLQPKLAGASDAFLAKLSFAQLPGMKLSTPNVDYGGQLVGTTASAQTMTITNIGDLPLTVSSITSSGDFDVAAVAAPCSTGGALDPGLSCGMSVAFKPTAAGARTGAVTIVSNAPASPFAARLSGTGTDFSLGAQTGAATSATVSAGQTATYNLQLSPSGFSGQVQLGCAFQGSAPARASCSVAPAAVTLNGTDPAPFTVTVTTVAQSASAPIGNPSWPRTILLLAMAALLLALFARNFQLTSTRTPALRWAAPLGMLLLAISLWTSCGSGGITYFSTPAGSYNLTITATANGVTRTTTLMLKVN